jgi:hypothetical protein
MGRVSGRSPVVAGRRRRPHAGSGTRTQGDTSSRREGLGATQQFGLTRARDWAGSIGRAGYSEAGERLAFLFRIVGPLFVAVSSTAGVSSPGKANCGKSSRLHTRVKPPNIRAPRPISSAHPEASSCLTARPLTLELRLVESPKEFATGIKPALTHEALTHEKVMGSDSPLYFLAIALLTV